MTATKGIKLYGERAIAALFKEYEQLDNMKVFGKVDKSILTPEVKKKVLRAINLIKEKHCGKIKARTCANGAPQRKYIPREEASSPTLKLESLMALILINAYEKRDVAIFVVPGAYIFADIDKNKFAQLKIEEKFVKIMNV